MAAAVVVENSTSGVAVCLLWRGGPGLVIEPGGVPSRELRDHEFELLVDEVVDHLLEPRVRRGRAESPVAGVDGGQRQTLDDPTNVVADLLLAHAFHAPPLCEHLDSL